MTIPIPTYPGPAVTISGPVTVTGTVTIGGGAVNAISQGSQVLGAALTANPLVIGGENPAGNVTALQTDTAGRILVSTGAAVGTETSPNVTNVATAVLVLNTARRGATIVNEGPATCLLALLPIVATTTAYTVALVTGAYYEVPFGYTGAVTGITVSSTAQLRVTEFA